MITASGKDLMLDALKGTNPTTPITHVGAFDGTAQTGLTSVAATDIFTKTAHGFAAGDLVTFSGLTGGTGIKVGFPYFVVATNLAANTFSVSEKPAGAIADHTTNVTAGTVTRFVEIAGGSPAYARKSHTYNTPSFGTMDDSNSPVLDIPPGASVDALGDFSAVTAGTLLVFDEVTPEAFAAQGTYTVTDADIDLNLADA